MPLSRTPYAAALERLVAAGGVQEVVQAVMAWRELGLVDAIGLWLHHAPTDGLTFADARGVGTQLVNWRPGHRDAGGPLWEAMAGTEPVAIDLSMVPLALAAPLRVADSAAWFAHGLHGPGGQIGGVVLCGHRVWEGDRVPCDAAGLALHRAKEADHHRWRSGWFDALAELTHDGVIMATPDGEVHAYNDALQGLTGWTLEDIRAHGWTNLVYPDPKVRADLQRAIAALVLGKASKGTVRTMARKDGTEVRASVWSRLLPHPAGTAPGMLGVIRDVTAERSVALQRSREESLSKLGRLAGGVAHEFNNLLAAIMGHAELIEITTDDEKLQSRARTIVSSTRRGATLSKQLLAFSGSTMSQTQPMRADDLVRETVDLLRIAFPRTLALSFDAEPDLTPVEADAPQLQQALTNLITNGRDAASEKVHVQLSTAPMPEAPKFRAVDAPAAGSPMCRIRVHDDGDGFSPTALAHLFEPFFSSKSRGHGLGLPAVRGIIGTHQGAVHVHNDNGAVIDLFLPFSSRPELALPRLAAHRSGGTGTVWLIDDEPALLEFARISLEVAGYSVAVCTGGEAAVELARAGNRPHLLVVDVVMPDKPGPEVVDDLREAGVDAPVLWTSGYTPESAKLVTRPGRFLQKPFTGRELAAAVAAVLDQHLTEA